jgi:hypothetical protein
MTKLQDSKLSNDRTLMYREVYSSFSNRDGTELVIVNLIFPDNSGLLPRIGNRCNGPIVLRDARGVTIAGLFRDESSLCVSIVINFYFRVIAARLLAAFNF